MRDYNHWYTIGCLSELLPRAENRVTLAEHTDRHGMPVARLDYTQCHNDRALASRLAERLGEKRIDAASKRHARVAAPPAG